MNLQTAKSCLICMRAAQVKLCVVSSLWLEHTVLIGQNKDFLFMQLCLAQTQKSELWNSLGWK